MDKQNNENVVEFINDDGEIEIQTNNKSDKVLKEFKTKQELNAYLTDRLTGVEVLADDGPVLGVFYKEDYKVIIPFEEFVPNYMVDESIDLESQKIIMHRRLNSIFDYKIVAINEEGQIVVGSRKEAIKDKVEKFWFGKNQNDDFLIKEGSLIEARIISASKSWVIVEALGIEQMIHAKDVKHTRVWDISRDYKTGDSTLVRVMEINRNFAKNEIDVQLSIKEAYDNPIDQQIDRFNINDAYLGSVSMIDKNGIYVELDNGVEVLCKVPHKGIAPVPGNNVTVIITNINKEQKRIFGIITHVASVW